MLDKIIRNITRVNSKFSNVCKLSSATLTIVLGVMTNPSLAQNIQEQSDCDPKTEKGIILYESGEITKCLLPNESFNIDETIDKLAPGCKRHKISYEENAIPYLLRKKQNGKEIITNKGNSPHIIILECIDPDNIVKSCFPPKENDVIKM